MSSLEELWAKAKYWSIAEGRNLLLPDPEVLKALIELLYEAGASKVYVGDMSALIRGGTAKNVEQTGIAAAARSAGRKPSFSKTTVGSKSN